MIKADQVAVANDSAPCLNPSLVERRLPSHHPSQQSAICATEKGGPCKG